MILLDYAMKLAPYADLIEPPPPSSAEYVRRQYNRWSGDAEQFLLSASPEDVTAALMPHCMRRLTAMAAVFRSLAKERR